MPMTGGNNSNSSAPGLIHRHFFGLKGGVHNNIAFAEEGVLVYPCGHNVVIYNLESKEQQFLHGVETTGRGITALAVAPNKRYVAVAEQAERAVVHIHDLNTLRRRKTLTLSDAMADTCVWVAFSGDSKYCITQGGAPDWVLSLWLWEKTKLLASVKASTPQGNAVHQADFSPNDPLTICASGNGLLKFFRFTDGQLRLQATPLKREPAHFLRHAWVSDDRVVASADSGELWLFEQFEFRQILTPPTTGTTGDGSFVKSLLGYSKGFVCGGSGGCVRIYDRSDDGGSREYYKKAKTFRIEGDTSTIKDLAISPSEDLLVCSLENNQLYALTLSSTDILKEDAMNFELVSTAFHAPSGNGSCHITGLDTCIRKPLVVTCALDRSVRVWNYLDKSTDILKFFREDALCVAFHPSGLHVVVGFTDKLRMLNVLMDDIRSCREFAIKGCREVQFSHGGQFFAAANNNVVHVYATYTGELVAVLRGHSNRVTAISWKPDDRKLLTCGADGTVLLWSLRAASKVGEGHSQARCSYIDAALAPEGDIAYVTGSDNMLKEIDMASGLARAEHWTGGNGATLGPLTLANSQQVLFVGSAEPGRPGMVRLYRLPLEKERPPPTPALGSGGGQSLTSPGSIITSGQTGSTLATSTTATGSTNQSYTEYHCHDLPVSRLRLSFDNQFLFSAGEDGSLCIFETVNVIGKGSGSGTSSGQSGGVIGSREARGDSAMVGGGGNGANGSGLPFAEEILVTKSDLEEKNRLMNELKSKVDELTLHNEYQLRLKDLNYKEKIKEVSDKFTAELTQDRQRCGDLQNDKTEMENEYQKKMREMASAHRSEVQELKTTYEAKVEAEKARYAALEQARGEQNTRFEEENHLLVESHTQFLAEMTTEYDQKVAREQELQAVCARAKEELIATNESLKRALEEDAELEVEELKTKYELKLSDEREATLRLKGENGIMKKKFSALQKDIEDQRDEIRSLEEKGKELAENIRGLEKDIQGHKKEIREREETIQDKEKRIYDLKKKNQELEKFKFVLDYKIKELKRQIEPREQEIADMKTQIEEMDAELEQYHKSNAALDLMIGELRLKMDGMQKELNLQAAQVALGKALVRQVQTDLLGCAQLLDNKKALKIAVMALNKKYEDGVTPDAKEPNSQAEYNRQREYLEKEVESLKRKIMKGMAISESELHRLQRENAILTTQVNELRREFHNVRMQTQEVRETKYKTTVTTPTNKKLSVSSEVLRERKEKMREAEFQKDLILQLKDRLTELQKTLGGGLKFALTGSSSSPQHRQQQYTRKPVPPTTQRLPPV
ncbi:Cilia- and flagella-associated protein 57 [Phytophthora rubi]|uniref:Cilia-and flagella-associated protein 57 n=1 Tax=Phytophthora rubi TaxID=129364 RepID=A0A6A3NUM5_9STRA|nr:Cilia- and flagella-associated protein 57 [Phytophthora rubi]KAE9051454.1 Cilia- and flagella-associated protein 57 [Phytophthora rubi]KAE9356154.1 Cilia- and flagella-associated protein 57 [Phytophthora rubi]